MGIIFDILVSIAITAIVTSIVLLVSRRSEQSIRAMHASIQKELHTTGVVLKEFRKFKAAFDTSYDAMVIADVEGRIIYVNDSVTRITGYSREEALGTKAGSLWGKLMPKEYYEKLWAMIKTNKKPYYGQITNHRKNGERYTAAVSITPVFDDEYKNVEFFVAVERDLREQVIL
jgi:PAS domain S-box-containing protein